MADIVRAKAHNFAGASTSACFLLLPSTDGWDEQALVNLPAVYPHGAEVEVLLSSLEIYERADGTAGYRARKARLAGTEPAAPATKPAPKKGGKPAQKGDTIPF
jgi:hypothetical protein